MSVEDQKRHHLKGYDFWSQLSATCHQFAFDKMQEGRLATARVQQEIGADCYLIACRHRDQYLFFCGDWRKRSK